jgi:hypothetical protein
MLQPMCYYKIFVEKAVVGDALLMIPNMDDYPPHLFVKDAINSLAMWGIDRFFILPFCILYMI